MLLILPEKQKTEGMLETLKIGSGEGDECVE